MQDGFIRVAAITPDIKVADVKQNAAEIERQIKKAAEIGCAAAVFPELCITAYTCGDLFREKLLLKQAEEVLKQMIYSTADLDILVAVGVPVAHKGKMYNCAAVFHKGRLLGLSSKKFIPNYSEFYEMRYFSPGVPCAEITYAGQTVNIGTDLIYSCENIDGLAVGVEICEDLWIPSPPSVRLAQNGATLIFNLSCSDEIVGKAEYRKNLVKMHSGRILAGYIYADSGIGESTTDMVFAGHNMIAENGAVLAESKLFSNEMIAAEIDIEKIVQERLRMNTWENERDENINVVKFSYDEETIRQFNPERQFPKSPFIPEDNEVLSERCENILTIQAVGLVSRIKHIGLKNVVLALSGGLDSTLALIVAVKAFDRLGLDRKGIHTISMPCFGTTKRTKSNAEKIAEKFGVHFQEISILKAVRQHLEDISHDENIHDIAYENAQARERTQVAMDMANKIGGLVVGTGDLSELALGWTTYNGDHMSMYGVNASIPKTLVRCLVKYAADQSEEALKAALYDILDTPVSPELLPPQDGVIAQKTEEIVGPYELHDFFLYYLLRQGFVPGKIFRMAKRTFAGEYTQQEIIKWMRVFYRRFFSEQYKRSCMPDGPKVGSVSLSPRGDFRMPSDACADLWMDEITKIEKSIIMD